MRYVGSIVLLFSVGSLIAQDTTNMLTPDQAVAIALEHNHGIRLARLQAGTSQVLNDAGNAGMLPVLGLNGLYSIDNSSTRQVFFSGEVRDADNANTQVLDGALSLNWTVFDGLAMFARKDRLEALELIGRSELKRQVETTIHDVLNNYYLAVQMESAVSVQREGLVTSRERLRIVEIGERLGAASGLELVQARLDLNADSSALLDLIDQRSFAVSALNTLMGRDPSMPVRLGSAIPATDELDLTVIRDKARTNNPSLAQAKHMQRLAEASVRELRGALLPQVDLFANYGYRRSTSDVGFIQSSRAVGPDYGTMISIPLFSGFQQRSALEVARIQQEQAALSTDQVQLQLDQQITDGWTTYNTARQRVAMESTNLEGIRQQVEVALESYRLGMLTAVELRDVQQGMITAENRLLLAQYEAKMAELRLKILAGEI